MALKIDYGNGTLGDVESITSTVNSYARVTAITSTSVTINNTGKVTGTATFTAGTKILIHVSATAAAADIKYLGCWGLATITKVNSNILTVDIDATQIIPSADLGKYYVQAIAVAEYKNLTLSTGTNISPPIYSTTNYHGGIVAIMCSETLKFDGGNISLTDRGIPVASKALRPTTANDVAADTTNYAGWENSDTRIHFMLNAGDGAAFIVAKKLICSDDSRIGNVATYGCQFFRGSSSSVTYNETKPTGVTNVGGSTIFIAAETIENFGHKMLAKYRASSSTAGQGICRCYIASNTKLRNDEGLYAYDVISDKKRLRTQMNVKDFGNGSFGDANGITTQLNNFATVKSIEGRKVSYINQTTAGLAQIGAGSLVMLHFNHKGNTNVVSAGRFIIANVLADNGSTLTLDADPPNISVTDYACQIIAIPQFNNFTLAVENSATPVFNGAQGGICAIAVKESCNLTGGRIYVKSAGAKGYAYLREGLAVIGNAQDCDKLPIGQGYGSVFILAKNLIVDDTARIGGVSNNVKTPPVQKYVSNGGGGHKGTYARNYGGSGKCLSDTDRPQCAHLMIVSDSITGFNQLITQGTNFGSGGHGGYNGGGLVNYGDHGGAAGWAFIYCNNAVNQDTTGTILAN